MTWRDVRLAYVHEYYEPEPDRVLAEIGYTIVQKFAGSVGADRSSSDPDPSAPSGHDSNGSFTHAHLWCTPHAFSTTHSERPG